MHYVILLYGDESAERRLGRDDLTRIIGEHGRFADELRAGGKLVLGHPLENSAGAKVVIGDVVTDGPFAETKEQLGGYYLVDCANLDEAIEASSRMPVLPRGGSVEIRAIQKFDDAG